MPKLGDIEYSRTECVAAVRDYYDFLTKMYLKESDIIEPPEEGGWPSVTAENLQDMDKTQEVVALLRQLPYIRSPQDDRDQAQGAANCVFADWESLGHSVALGRASSEELKLVSEGDISDDVPSQVIGLTAGGRNNPVFLLDTDLGIVHWPDCPDSVKSNPSQEPVADDPYEYADEEEAEWRAEAPAWAIPDFFEILKDQFRRLHFVPISSRLVYDFSPRRRAMLDMLKEVYRGHHWPDVARYNKEACLQAVQTLMEEHYPHLADHREDDSNL